MDALRRERPRTTRRDGRPVPPDNRRIAQRLREAAHLLCVQGASSYRVQAYRAAADAVERNPRAMSAVFDAEGVKGLDAIPHVGLGIASAIAEMLRTQRWALLERLRESVDAATVFQSVPGVGPSLARRIHDTLRIDTLEDLDTAAHDGRLESLRGVGTRRVAGWRASLDEMLGRIRPEA